MSRREDRYTRVLLSIFLRCCVSREHYYIRYILINASLLRSLIRKEECDSFSFSFNFPLLFFSNEEKYSFLSVRVILFLFFSLEEEELLFVLFYFPLSGSLAGLFIFSFLFFVYEGRELFGLF